MIAAPVSAEPLDRAPINAMDRDPVREPLDTGVRAINALLTVGRGQRIGLFAGIEECRFKRVVQPGDRLSLEVTMEKLGRRFGRGRGVASVDGEVCCEATISFIIPPEGVLG